MSIMPVEEQLRLVDLRRIRASLQAYRRGRFDRGDLHTQGLRYLGSGCFGEAYSIDGTRLVVKFSGRAYAVDRCSYKKECGTRHKFFGGLCSDAERPEHDGWQVFAQEVMRNPHPNLPHIMHFERISSSFAWAVMPYYEEDCRTKSPPRAEWRMALLGDQKWLAAHPFLAPFSQMCELMGLTVDLHSGNVRYDQEKDTFVIIDPFSAAEASSLGPFVITTPS